MSTAFPRTVLPMGATWPRLPGGFRSVGLSGKSQVRSGLARGFSWTEEYPPLKASDVTTQAFLAQVQSYFFGNTILDVDHRSRRTRLGLGGGVPLVNGAPQVGKSLITDGWTPSVAVLKAGDILTVAGMLGVQQVDADVASNGSGQATLTLTPGYLAGASPADNAALTLNAIAPGTAVGLVTYRCIIVEEPNWPTCPPNEWYAGFNIKFAELL